MNATLSSEAPAHAGRSSGATPPRWFDARPWHTNAALLAIGCGMIGITRQMIRENDGYTIGFSGCSSAHVVLYLAAALIVLALPKNVNRLTFGIILFFGIACRLVALYPEPFLSSDVYRYAWDGVVQHAHISPYRYVPGDPALTALRAPNQDLFDNMNRRDYARTIYPPAAQVAFFLITWISPTVTFMKTAMVLFEGLTMWGLLQLLRGFGLPREQSILYAWSPLLIWEIGGSGHLDSMAMAFIVLALLMRSRDRAVLTGVFLAVAVLTKFYPLVLFPALWRRGDWKMPATLAGLTVAFYALYLSAGRLVFGFLGGYVQEEGMSTGERYFLLEQLHHVPGLGGVPNEAYLAFCGLIFAALTLWCWRVATPAAGRTLLFLKPALALAMALMLLFSPHYPWYVAWLVPLLVLLPGLPLATYICGLFYLCTTALAVGSGPKQFRLNQILYSAVLVAAILDFALRRSPRVRAALNRVLPLPLRTPATTEAEGDAPAPVGA